MDHPERGALEARDAAAYLGISYDSLNRIALAGRLTARAGGENGGKRVFLRRDLDAYLDALPLYEPRTREKSA